MRGSSEDIDLRAAIRQIAADRTGLNVRAGDEGAQALRPGPLGLV
jgi:hypothetical protein